MFNTRLQSLLRPFGYMYSKYPLNMGIITSTVYILCLSYAVHCTIILSNNFIEMLLKYNVIV